MRCAVFDVKRKLGTGAAGAAAVDTVAAGGTSTGRGSATCMRRRVTQFQRRVPRVYRRNVELEPAVAAPADAAPARSHLEPRGGIIAVPDNRSQTRFQQLITEWADAAGFDSFALV